MTPGSPCNGEICITCSDQAFPAKVLELLDDGMARADTGPSIELISLDLVEADVGDIVMVHAGVAIGKIHEK